VRWFPGCRSPLARPEGLDLVVVRENLEDLYVGIEGELAALGPLDLVSATARRPLRELGAGRFALKVITEAGSDRVARFAWELARRRGARRGRQGRLACGTKHNMLPRSDGLFRERVERMARGYPDVDLQCLIVDDLAHRLVADPRGFDVIVLPNLYGDLLSDEAAALAGGLGLAPSGCFGDDYAYFEPAHGTAPDLAGRNVINPTATLLSGAMLLDHLGFADAAARLEHAVERVYAEGKSLTPDQGGSASTTELCRAVEDALR
jgi:isocitrate/isopropylmalate dehydrogenase